MSQIPGKGNLSIYNFFGLKVDNFQFLYNTNNFKTFYARLTALIEAHYLPSIAFFAAICRADSILLERNEYFAKQTYRNRCRINTANGELDLVVPVTSKHGKVVITDVRVDFTQKWLNNHWRTVQSAYGKAPFFEYYSDDLHNALFKRVNFLYE